MNKAKKLRIFSSESCKNNRKIIQTAVEKLVLEGYAEAVPLRNLISPHGETQLLVIDGDDKKEASALLAPSGIHADFHVVVTQLGIETRDSFNEDELELLIDGIKAACTVTDGPLPQFNCPCCGSS